MTPSAPAAPALPAWPNFVVDRRGQIASVDEALLAYVEGHRVSLRRPMPPCGVRGR